MATYLTKWYEMPHQRTLSPISERAMWEIPEDGAEIWCTAWPRGQVIKPYGDGCHVVVGLSVYHCDELMGILMTHERDGSTWGINGVRPKIEQKVNGVWVPKGGE